MNIPHYIHLAARKLAASCLVAALLLLLSAAAALAQSPDVKPGGSNPILFLPNDLVPVTPKPPADPAQQNPMLFLPALSSTGSPAPQQDDLAGSGVATLEAARARQAPATKLLIDTDPGVDDAVAISWLFTQREQPLEFLGIVTVAGNTTVDNATNNAILILKQLGRGKITIVKGAAAPRVQPLTKTSYFVHGPDGLWFLGWQHLEENLPELLNVRSDASAFYCETLRYNPGIRILALGPLADLAQVIETCPDQLPNVGQLVMLGGAKFGGNKTTVAEFNFWQDPEAAEIVLKSGLPITLVLLDAFTQPSFAQKDLDKLFAKETSAVKFLAPAIQQYAHVQLTNTGRAGIPDAVAAVVALRPSEGTLVSALVKMVIEPSQARGQSLVGLTDGERITMLTSDEVLSGWAAQAFTPPSTPNYDPDFNVQTEMAEILKNTPDNAMAVTSASASLLTKTVFRDLSSK